MVGPNTLSKAAQYSKGKQMDSTKRENCRDECSIEP